MRFIGICASTLESEGVIGDKNNKLPWRIDEEIQLFKKLTINNVVVMGRKTYETIGHPLVKRKNIVLSRSRYFLDKQIIVANSLNDVLRFTKTDNQVFIIGGKEIFILFKQYIDSWYISWIKKKYEGTIKIKWKEMIGIDFKLINVKHYHEFIHCQYRRKHNEIFHN